LFPEFLRLDVFGCVAIVYMKEMEKSRKINGVSLRLADQAFCGELLQIVRLRRGLQP
jgi:hypothetical protein